MLNIENTSDLDINVSLIDSKGLMMQSFTLNGATTKRVDISSWTPGLYLVEDNSGSTYKFIVTK